MGSDDAIGFYKRRALDWVNDRNKQAAFFEKGWLDRFCGVIAPHGTILDLGCGSGKPMAAYLIARGFGVHGVDATPAMVALAQADFPAQQWSIGDMRELSLGRAFDAVLAWDSFFHLAFDDQRRMFPIFRAHAKPGAPLMFTSGPRHGEAIGSLYGEPLHHASLAPDEYRALLSANDFAVIDARMEDPECGGRSVWLAQRLEDR
jgi:SAM-dependent methyltransferase